MIGAGLADAATKLHETIVVGSGPAGLTLALELARYGRPALVLESGLTRPGAAQALSAAEIVAPGRHDDMSVAVARRLGGTSNLWGGRCAPLDPIDFAPRAFAQDARWPIRHKEIARFYEIACRYAHCGEAAFDLAAPEFAAEDGDFSLANIERASNKPRFHKAHAAALAASRLVDVRLGLTVVDLELAEDGRVMGVIVAAEDGARSILRADRVVLAAGGLESTRLLLALQRRRAALFGGEGGPLGRYYMGHIIGEIADIVVADERLDAALDFLIDGRGSFVRRRFTPSPRLIIGDELPNIAFWPVVPPIADPRHASGPLSAVALALSTPLLGRALVPEAIRSRHLAEPIDWLAHARNVAADIPATASFLGGFMRQRYLSAHRIPGYFLRDRARRYGLSYHAEQSPRRNSRVTLARETDALGLPRLRIDLKFAREDAAAVARAHDRLAHWLAASGLGHIEYRQPAPDCVDAVEALMSHGTHQIGTARMGSTRRDGVVDRDLRCFDCANLFVVGSAVFPTSGQANPTLSIVAFAARLAATLAAEANAVPQIVTRASEHA
jgi:glycine/D-amino acid oxidase-like deaminating enzyme